MKICVSGPPSCGKSEQARRLAKVMGVPHVSSGDLIRAAAAAGDPEGVKVAAQVADGSLAPSDMISRMVLARLERPDCSQGYVLDGFPRRPEEARALLAVAPPIFVLVLSAPEDELMARLAKRVAAAGANVRPDDDPAKFPRRLAAYAIDTVSAREELVRAGTPVLCIDAAGTLEETFVHVQAAFELLGEQPALAF